MYMGVAALCAFAAHDDDHHPAAVAVHRSGDVVAGGADIAGLYPVDAVDLLKEIVVAVLLPRRADALLQ